MCVLIAAFLLQAKSGSSEAITPLPLPPLADPARLHLGERLFWDVRLSGDGTRACVTCHDPAAGGASHGRHDISADGRPLDYNTPTIFNAGLNFRLAWRGNSRQLEELTGAVLVDPRLMAGNWADLLARLRADYGYRVAFDAAYHAKPDKAQVIDALVVYQRALLTPDAPFDRFLRGEPDALTRNRRADGACSGITAASPATRVSISTAICSSASVFLPSAHLLIWLILVGSA